jgi:hypothetical protein
VGFELDDAAVIADNLRHQCKTKARAGRLGRDERIEQMAGEVAGNAAAIVAHADFKRQADRLLAVMSLEADAGTIRRGQRISPS